MRLPSSCHLPRAERDKRKITGLKKKKKKKTERKRELSRWMRKSHDVSLSLLESTLVRKTMTIVHRSKARDIEKNQHAQDSDSAYTEEVKDRRNVMVRPLVGIVLAITLTVAAFVGVFKKASPTISIVLPPETKVEELTATAAAEKRITSSSQLSYKERLRHPRVIELQNCTVSFNAPANMSFPPIWMPSFPASGAASASKKGDLLKPIVDKLTGWASGSKNYHMSIKNKLKRCHAVNTPTAVCTNGHPMTAIGPQKQTSNFHRKVIMVVRNFYTAYPAFVQDKAFAYHGAKEQVPKEEWISSRDEWTKSSFETWKSFFVEWKTMNDYYDIGTYVVYEKLVNPDVGISVVERLAEQLKQAGLEIAPAEQIPCIWYQSVEPEYRRLESFYKYNPAYTPEQREYFITEMYKLIQDMNGEDEELVLILQEYVEEIRSYMPIDA